MSFQVSPGVNTSEIDLTTVVPAVAVSTGAIAGEFTWGPVESIRQISNEVQLVSTFGEPVNGFSNTFFTAASFLAYSNDLRVVRGANTTSNNAFANLKSQASFTAYQIKNEDDYLINRSSGVASTCFAAKYPGALGNSLKVCIWANTTVAMSTWTYGSLFNKTPATSNYIATNFKSNANDEMHIVVVDEDGLITGTANTILETFPNLSKATNSKDETGQSLYYKDVLNRSSKYIYWTGHPGDASGSLTSWGVDANSSYIFPELPTTSVTYSLTGGGAGATGLDAALTNADIIRAYDQLKSAEAVDISLVMTAAHPETVVLDVVNNLAGSRKDCVAFLSPSLANTQSSDPTTAINNYRKNALANVSSSYSVMDSGWKYMYDKYNDVYRYIPLNGDIAGLCARTDSDRDPWWSPAGITRGQIKNLVKLAYNPSKANRDELYKNDVNPVVSFPGEGTLLFGDKTLLGRPSAFDRINVRRLFIVLEKSISKAARSSLFEFNDDFTRAQFVNLVEPFLRTVQGRRGIYDYRVVCDTTNNTPEVIDRNEFVGDIYIKPAKSINFIQLNFVAVRTGVAFEEVVGKF